MSLDTTALLSELRGLLPAAAQMTADTSRVGRGDVFLAFPGDVHDARQYIASALAAGAAAEHNLRGLRLPDDHFAVWLTTIFIMTAGLALVNEAFIIPMYMVSIITFI